MSKIINPDSAGKERTRLAKCVVLAVRELARQADTGAETHDLVAFISLALNRIAETIDISVTAWEKRGYWVKADRFRMEWEWAGVSAESLRKALQSEDWGSIAQSAAKIAQKLGKITVPPGHRLGTPWVGAWQEMNRK